MVIGFVRRLIDERLHCLAEKRSQQYIQHYAIYPDGSRDDALACRIDHEVHRRAAMGRELDVYEPLRWIGISSALSAVAGITVMATTEKQVSRPAIKLLLISTALNSAIQLVRLYPRYDAGLKGGLDTALAMQEFSRLHPYDPAPLPTEWTQRITGSALADISKSR